MRALRPPEGVDLPDTPRGVALVLDADRTLAPIDTGRAVGQAVDPTRGLNQRIREVFETGGYTDDSFARVSQLWSAIPLALYEEAIGRVAREIELHPAWVEVLAALGPEIPARVVTAGIAQVWRRALAAHGLAHVHVIGGCHAALDSYFVTAESKAGLVRALRARGAWVVAAGDSEIDLPMLKLADLALFVADSKGSPRLLRRLGEVPGVHHFITDARRFDLIPAMDSRRLSSRLGLTKD